MEIIFFLFCVDPLKEFQRSSGFNKIIRKAPFYIDIILLEGTQISICLPCVEVAEKVDSSNYRVKSCDLLEFSHKTIKVLLIPCYSS